MTELNTILIKILLVSSSFLTTLLLNFTKRILNKTILFGFCCSSFWNVSWQTSGLQQQAVETVSPSLPSASLTTFSHACLPSLRSPACAAGACQQRCWWTRSSYAPRWKSLSEPRIRATPAWPTSPPQPRGEERPRTEITRLNVGISATDGRQGSVTQWQVIWSSQLFIFLAFFWTAACPLVRNKRL